MMLIDVLFTAGNLTTAAANTISVGTAFELTPFVGLAARYDFRDRSGHAPVHRASAVVAFRFSGAPRRPTLRSRSSPTADGGPLDPHQSGCIPQEIGRYAN